MTICSNHLLAKEKSQIPQGGMLFSLYRIIYKESIDLCTLIKSFVSCYNPFHEGELSRTKALLSTPTEPANTRKCTELAHVNLCAVSVNTTPGTVSGSFKVSLDISTLYCNHKQNTQIIRGRRK